MPKATMESKARVGAIKTVRVPKDLFSAATASGNHGLVQRAAAAEAQAAAEQSPTGSPHALKGPQSGGFFSPGGSHRVPPMSMRAGPLTLEKAGVKRRVPVPRPHVPEKEWTQEYHFDAQALDSFPPRYGRDLCMHAHALVCCCMHVAHGHTRMHRIWLGNAI